MNAVDDFLSAHGWSGAVQSPLTGDASSRRYLRLTRGDDQAILMIDPHDDTKRFSRIADHLRGIGFSAPAIIAHAPGLMLLEDFGDAQFAAVIIKEPTREIPLYQTATKVLCALEKAPLPTGLSVATADMLGGMIAPVFTNYLPALGAHPGGQEGRIQSTLTDVLNQHLPKEQVLILRDFHAENMIWLPERDGIKRVGLLDFQDALIGPPVYDLVSMLQDARRDVSKTCHDQVLKDYAEGTGRNMQSLLPAFHLLGLQRNLRILGIFARLALEKGKPAYLDLIPRVWAHIATSLHHPSARPLLPLIENLFPKPTPQRLAKIRSQCSRP